MPSNQRMRHYPMSHRTHGSFSAKAWSTTKPTGALGQLSTHINVISDEDYMLGDDHAHLWQAIFNSGLGTYRNGSIFYVSDDYVFGAAYSDPTWWPGPNGGHYYQGSSAVSLILTCGILQPYDDIGAGFGVNYQRCDRRNAVQHYWRHAQLRAKGSLFYTSSSQPVAYSSGSHFQVATFDIDRHFGSVLGSGGNPSSPPVIPAAADMIETAALPTIWHPGVEGEHVYDINYDDMTDVLRVDSFTHTTLNQAVHQPAIDEYNSVYQSLRATVVNFTGQYQVRACAHPLFNQYPDSGAPLPSPLRDTY